MNDEIYVKDAHPHKRMNKTLWFYFESTLKKWLCVAFNEADKYRTFFLCNVFLLSPRAEFLDERQSNRLQLFPGFLKHVIVQQADHKYG